MYAGARCSSPSSTAQSTGRFGACLQKETKQASPYNLACFRCKVAAPPAPLLHEQRQPVTRTPARAVAAVQCVLLLYEQRQPVTGTPARAVTVHAACSAACVQVCILSGGTRPALLHAHTNCRQVRTTLTMLAESQLELLSSIMPQHAIQ
eukprot:1141631-Pelagomonas_calceolata.AAC.9